MNARCSDVGFVIACLEPGMHGFRVFAVLRASSPICARDTLCTLPGVRTLLAVGLCLSVAASPSAAERGGLEAAARESAATPAPTPEPAEALANPAGTPVRWTEAPELVVLISVMRYHAGPGVEYFATDASLTEEEADELVANLTEALALLTDNSFTGFAAVHRETVRPGDTARIVRSGRIVVGRFKGLRELRQTIGLGGRVPGKDGAISSAAVLLDSDYDRTSAQRRLLRIHELGHALGYDHVDSRPSIMNARIGTALTADDREMARLAFSVSRYSAGTQ
jgi:hypothetical protein